jgi:hypothetical protein
MISWRSLAAGLCSLTLAAAVAVYAAPPPAAPPPVNPGPAVDRGKGRIERPTETVVADSAPAPAKTGDGFVNPKVEPGKVKWHASFDAACQASAKSGKPVLLFQMMGKLDEQFC